MKILIIGIGEIIEGVMLKEMLLGKEYVELWKG